MGAAAGRDNQAPIPGVRAETNAAWAGWRGLPPEHYNCTCYRCWLDKGGRTIIKGCVLFGAFLALITAIVTVAVLFF